MGRMDGVAAAVAVVAGPASDQIRRRKGGVTCDGDTVACALDHADAVLHHVYVVVVGLPCKV